jgi:DNA-binding CsgD family transcriptional regulator
MRQAIINVRDEDGAALGLADVMTVFRAAGLRDIEVLSCEGSRGVARIQVEQAIDEQRLTELPTVTWWERVSDSQSGTAYLVEFNAQEAPDMIDACADDLLPCRTIDVDVNDDGFTFDVTGSHEAITDTISAYENAGATVSLETLRDYEHREEPLDALTPRQREVLEIAYEMGYFDVPRSASTEAVAAELDLDTSTVSEHLQRAERNLLSTVIARPA